VTRSGALEPAGADDAREPGAAVARWRQLTAVSRAVTYATSAEEILGLVVDQATDLLEAEKSVLMLTDEDGLLAVRAAHGVPVDLVERFRGALDETLVERLQGLFGAHESACFLGVPLVVRGQVIGLLAVLRAHSRSVTEEEEALLSALADQTAAPLEVARLDAELRRGLQLAKEKTLATLAHDLRSPLQAIEGFAQLVEQEVLGPVTSEQRGALSRIRMSGRHLLALQESMLEFARLGARAASARLVPTAAGDVATEAAAIVRADADARGHSLTVDVDEPLWVTADPDRLRRVLINLLANAVKYTLPGGRVALRTSRVERGAATVWNADGAAGSSRAWAEITVTDTGVGIAPEHLKAVFQPYYRAPGAATAATAGAGLGLAICRELVEQMGGSIAAESEPGIGSTFVVRLPLADEVA